MSGVSRPEEQSQVPRAVVPLSRQGEGYVELVQGGLLCEKGEREKSLRDYVLSQRDRKDEWRHAAG